MPKKIEESFDSNKYGIKWNETKHSKQSFNIRILDIHRPYASRPSRIRKEVKNFKDTMRTQTLTIINNINVIINNRSETTNKE